MAVPACPSPKSASRLCRLIRRGTQRKNLRVLELILLLGRSLAVAGRGHHELILENIALRQQLAAVKRRTTRPRLRRRDRLFWVALAALWTQWRTALILVQPGTVVRWHREWFRRGGLADHDPDASVGRQCSIRRREIWSARWRRRIRCGERRASTVNSARSGLTSRSEQSRASWRDSGDRRHRPGVRSSRTTW
jgi:hypothetical protein